MIKSKKVLAFGAVAALALAACGSDDSDDSSSTEAPADTEAAADTEAPADTEAAADTEAPADTEASGGDAEGGLICEVTDVGGVDDNGFNQLAWEGAQRAAEDFGMTAEVLESSSDADYAPNIQAFIEKGCDLIITVGFLLGDATAEAAAANPDQQFTIIDFGYEEPFDNVRTLNFAVDGPSYMAGYLAAGMSETGSVATYGGIEIPPVTVFMVAYAAGVDYYNSQNSAEVVALGTATFTGNFENLDDGKNLASSFADEGADIVFPVAGPVGLGSAAYATESGGMRIIGVDSDGFLANPADAAVYLTSVLKKIDNAVYDAVETIVVNGENGGGYLGDLTNDGVGLAPYHDQEGDVPAELTAEVEAIGAAIIAGEIDPAG